MRSHKRPADAAQGFPLPRQLKAAVSISVASFPAPRYSEALQGGPAAVCEYPLQGLVRTICNDQAGPGESANKVVELPLDSREIGEDVRVIELQIIENCGLGAVV